MVSYSENVPAFNGIKFKIINSTFMDECQKLLLSNSLQHRAKRDEENENKTYTYTHRHRKHDNERTSCKHMAIRCTFVWVE